MAVDAIPSCNMIVSPRAITSPSIPPPQWPEIDDDDGWQDMPVVRSDDNPLGLDEEDQKKFRYQPPARLDDTSQGGGSDQPIASTSNATGQHLEVDADTLITDSWRTKIATDESDYTRLRLDEDEESEEVMMRTKYLFNEDKAMTPLSQMQATKELLTEGQRIAYVGLCALIMKKMVRDAGRGWEGMKAKGSTGLVGKGKGKSKEDVPVVESAHIWMLKIMARLYQHMELEKDEQTMIESLAEHGVDPTDLVPALMTTHTVKNPEFDPAAKAAAELGSIVEEGETSTEDIPPPPYTKHEETRQRSSTRGSESLLSPTKSINPFGDDDDEDASFPFPSSSTASIHSIPKHVPAPIDLPPPMDDDEGDIGSSLTPTTPRKATTPNPTESPTMTTHVSQEPESITPKDEKSELEARETQDPEVPALPSLPGVTKNLSKTDEMVTLDIRWTVLCDLFLVLVADSVYDSRSRAFLERVAITIGFEWLDVVRFENRVTDALEIQEGVEKTQSGEIIEGRRKGALKKRYAMMGLAAVGGGLVIGLSAGLLAPVIGAGLGAAFATVGITGTSGFLAGAGGAALITSGGVLTGANIAGKGMARRTREVRTFELRPLHNNKRVSCYVTVGGFMASKVDDVRLPFSTLDPIVGDVYSILWEPEMMAEMGSALKILTSEILTQGVQQVLQATVMTALLSALQWPIILTKLGYLIDNPWSNALDRARAAGLVLADTIMQRHAGVRPVSLIGYSLGARAIFYCLVELARAKAYGLIQDVFLFGATVTASKSTWLDVRSAVAGRFVNGFATNDWMLGYLFRATSGGLNTVAGLRPVETVPGMENIEVTDIITGHMSYRTCMPQLLKKAGFPVTADYFDEPDDPEIDHSIQQRTVVNESEEEAKRNRKKILGIFPRTGKSSRSGSGVTTPTNRPSHDAKSTTSSPYDGVDDDLPPRESTDIRSSALAAESKDSIATSVMEEEEVKAIPKTAGFDFKAISKELGKDIDVDKLPAPKEPAPAPPTPTKTTFSAPERSGSAPPITIVPPPSDEISSWSNSRSVSYTSSSFQSGDEPGDITSSGSATPAMETPSWDRPASTPLSAPKISPPISSGGNSSWKTSSGWNAWSSSSSAGTAETALQRSAPPARPHPPELMANPFASSNGDLGKNVLGGWGKKAVDDPTQNPW